MDMVDYLTECRSLVIEEIRGFIPACDEAVRPALYDLMLDYPLREAKALRPALCIAACRALGGRLQAVLPSAAVLEFYHNAFLIHDDIEDGSHERRGRPTLHREHGVAVALNVGDAMLALALRPLLNNTRTIGLGKALRVLETVAHMSEVSVEGQALELDWRRRQRWDLTDADYLRMVEKKTAWYSFVVPLQVGAIAAGASDQVIEQLTELGRALGLAFQIQDDVLNLEESAARYGKELAGDLWEGKRTLILLHMLRMAEPDERAQAQRVLELDRPIADTVSVSDKTLEGIFVLRSLIDKYGSLDYARTQAARLAASAREALRRAEGELASSIHLEFIDAMVDYVHTRDH